MAPAWLPPQWSGRRALLERLEMTIEKRLIHRKTNATSLLSPSTSITRSIRRKDNDAEES
jgi:hypothetical protein